MEKKFDKAYFTRDRIKLGTKGSFDPKYVDDNYLKTFGECGFDWVVVNPSNAYGDVRDRIMDFCDKNGIEVYLDDRKTYNDKEALKEYEYHECYTGSYLSDEPGSDYMPELSKKTNAYLEETGRHPHVNLLPMYANAAQLKYGADVAAIEYYDPDPDLYYKHVSTWAGLSKAKYMSVDIYPLNCNPDMKYATYGNYIENINIFGRVAREYNKEFVAYIQCYGWCRTKRDADVDSLRFQVYSMLSFGCKGIVFWSYGAESSYTQWALVDHEGNPRPVYRDTKQVIGEIRKISDVYCTYKNIGAFNVNYDPETCAYLRMTNPVEFPDIKIDAIDYFDKPSPLLVGCFEAKEGKGKAFTVVNMRELITHLRAKVKFTVDEQYTKVTAYIKGEPTVLTPDENGEYMIPLECGEGAFVTIE
ncbi:MAG: hypothetical protein E7588_05635 [Ruminococcaceae bacterium]|nr:hypothetical protein [Oscillospiraceae bacterium]